MSRFILPFLLLAAPHLALAETTKPAITEGDMYESLSNWEDALDAARALPPVTTNLHVAPPAGQRAPDGSVYDQLELRSEAETIKTR